MRRVRGGWLSVGGTTSAAAGRERRAAGDGGGAKGPRRVVASGVNKGRVRRGENAVGLRCAMGVVGESERGPRPAMCEPSRSASRSPS
ncbi:hypothetical protein CC80DRAFT_47846 [Byssothecium circinans]|uniref:Uncharacterized protein n=1 Tax=Byssothecium circinans TaxID=147558 RepID=A0A6A5U0W1_9PLEO|nr:hypothetical protein CC80DRAFT_47846 [Byssothecium circinans]